MFQLGIGRISEFEKLFTGKRLGMLTSASGTDTRLRLSVSVLHQAYGVKALYGPEHGVNGAADAGELVEGRRTDEATGATVYSLYTRESKNFTAEMLEDVDAVVYDIQDLGLRFYTYISSLLNAVRDCAKFGKELIVLDRPNPLGGRVAQGGRLHAGCESFVGMYDMPIRYGLTAGEFAQMVNAEQQAGCRLTVIPMRGWKREMLFPQLGYPFLMPSPSIPNFHNALLYAGTCLIEGTNVSEGRGTADPFALIGAPYISAGELTGALQQRGIPGVLFTPAYFTPTASKHAGIPCQGVHLHLTDPVAYPAVEAGVLLLDTLRSLYPKYFAFLERVEENAAPMIDLLSGSTALRKGVAVEELLTQWRAESKEFEQRAKAYWLYE